VSDQVENLKPEDVSIGDRPLSIPSDLPILPLRDNRPLFQFVHAACRGARELLRLIDDAIRTANSSPYHAARRVGIEEPSQDDLYTVGTATHIHKMFKLPDGSLRLIVQRARPAQAG